MKILVAMPMKNLQQAKSRMASLLGKVERARLAASLFERSQHFFATAYPGLDRLVVTPSLEIVLIARSFRANALREPVAGGLNVATARACRWAAERGYDRILIVPCDIAVWSCRELDCVIDQSRRCDVVVASSVDGGTNALSLPLPNALPFRYGRNSARRHLAEARRRRLSAIECRLPSLSHDLDTPRDFLLAATVCAAPRG